MEFLCSFLRSHLAGKPALASRNVGYSGDERLLNFENFLLTLALPVFELDDDTKETLRRRDVWNCEVFGHVKQSAQVTSERNNYFSLDP